MKVAPCPKTRAKTVPKIEIKKNVIPRFSKFKLLLNRNELENIIDMKRMHLDDIFPMAYHLLYSDERFRKNHENTLAATRHPPHHF